METVFDLSYTGKRPISHPATYRNDVQYLKSSSVGAKCSDSESFCCQMKSDLHLINLPWKYDGGGIT